MSQQSATGQDSKSRNLARIWPAFVNIERRIQTEGPFVLDHLPSKTRTVFDSCLGCGATSIEKIGREYCRL